MGLDMYLRERKYVSQYDKGDPKKTKVRVETTYQDDSVVEHEFEVENAQSGLYIELPVAYWRKANQIHRWFIELHEGTVDDCSPINVYGKDLVKLRETCESVLKDHSLAEKLLPSQEGFFFGSTEYDEGYFYDLEMTIKQLKDIDPEGYYVYEASW